MNTPAILPIRIMLVEDHAVVRAGLRMLVESYPSLQVVGEAANRAEALAVATSAHPDIILLDLDLCGNSSLEFLPDLLKVGGQARALLLTSMNDPETHRRAVRLGAMGVVLKEEAAEVLIKAIERVHAGEVWLDRSTVASILSEMSRPQEPTVDPEAARVASLTDRERQVILLICEGLQNRTLAERLFISETTVRHHLTAIFDKLGVTSRLELVIYAYRNGLAKPPHSGR